MFIIDTTKQESIHHIGGSRAPVGLAFNFLLVSLAALMVGCRILVKAKLRKLAIEDALIVLSTSIVIALVVMTKFSVKYGFGFHIGDINPKWWHTYTKYNYSFRALGTITYPLTKVSMLCFYLRLSPQPTFRKICFGTIGYILTTATVMFLINIFNCTPIRGGWDQNPELGAKCFDITGYLYFYTSMNIVTDVMLLILPIPILLRLQIRAKTKFGLVAMFAIGICISAISAYSLYTMQRSRQSKDLMWDGAYSWLWAIAEFNAGIIVACMPSMLLFAKWVRGDMTETNGYSAGAAHIPGQNATIGGSGRGGNSGAKRYGDQTEMTTLTSIRLGSQEYIMQDAGGIGKSTEVTVVEMALPPPVRRANDAGKMC